MGVDTLTRWMCLFYALDAVYEAAEQRGDAELVEDARTLVTLERKVMAYTRERFHTVKADIVM